MLLIYIERFNNKNYISNLKIYFSYKLNTINSITYTLGIEDVTN